MSSLVCGKAQPASVIWCQCCRWGLLPWMTELEMWLNNSSSLTLCMFSTTRVWHVSYRGGLRDNPTPGAHDNLNDWSLSFWLRWKGREQTAEQKEKRREEKRGVNNPTRSEWCPVFCFRRWDQWPVQPRGDRQSNWRPGRNRCSYTMNMHLVGCLFTKSQGADFPFFLETKKNTAKSHGFPPVGLQYIREKCCWGNQAHI